jgi:glycosyltransferase involved in cell wall biosynthesis
MVEYGYMLSVVVPVYNEKESLPHFFNELIKNLVKIGKSYEIIFVDDGSNDNSLEILKEFEEKNKNVRVFSFRKNRGKAEALTLGFHKAKGEYVITLDADLQDKPEGIKPLLDKLDEGYDLVSGWRKTRKDSITKVIFSKIFNLIASTIWGLKLHDYNCGLKVYRNDAVKELNLYGGMHRFIPLISYSQGFKVAELAIDHQERKYGKSKYGASKAFKDLPDMFTMIFLQRYSKRPMHFFGVFGSILFGLGAIILIYLSILRFQGQSIGDRPLLLFGILLVLAGFQVFFTGFLADLVLHINQKNEQSDSPSYILKYSSD